MFKEIDINLATLRYRRGRAVFFILILSSILTVVFGLYDLRLYLQKDREIEVYRKRLKALQGLVEKEAEGLKRLEVPDGDEIRALVDRVRFVNRLINEGSFSWIRLMNHLESTLPEEVSLLQIQPGRDRRVVTITGMAKSLEDVFRFLRNLEGSQYFERSFLIRHSQEDDTVSKKEIVSFTIRTGVREGV